MVAFKLILATSCCVGQELIQTNDLKLKSGGSGFFFGIGGGDADIVPLFDDKEENDALFIL